MVGRTMVLTTVGVVLAAGLGAGPSDAGVRVQSEAVVLSQSSGGVSLPVSLQCPRFTIDDKVVGGSLTPSHVDGDVKSEKGLVCEYAPIPIDGSSNLEVSLHARWFPKESVLRKWASYRVMGGESGRLVKEIVLEEMDPAIHGTMDNGGWQSFPVFTDGFFLGIEFPVAKTRIENGRIVLAHMPGKRIRPGEWYESRTAVYGIAKPGDEVHAFERYIEAHRSKPVPFLANYNHWWSTHIRANEKDILGIMSTFEEKLYKPYGFAFDTFCIDLGWQEMKSVWGFDPTNFPQQFDNVKKAGERMGTAVGIWISPNSFYPQAMDNEWAKAQGYETFTIPWVGDSTMSLMCLAGTRYQKQFKEHVVDMTSKYHLGSIKFDGYAPECSSTEHGHEPGVLSQEAMADGMIDIFKAARKANPKVWLRPTCFGWTPSPWWLFYTNSVLGTYGDDSPNGRVPCPIYRESYTSSRDFFNLQGAARLPVPIAAQDAMGINHQTEEPLVNDAVICVMRGHQFMALYLNPMFMDDRRWESLAGVLDWARKNRSILDNTEPLIPASWADGKVPPHTADVFMPREPYGYAHWNGPKGLIALRNPWIQPAVYPLKLNGYDLSKKASHLTAVGIYPEARVYGRGLKYGDTLQVRLAPYETVVLSISPDANTGAAPDAVRVEHPYLDAKVSRQSAKHVDFTDAPGLLGSDWTNLVWDAKTGHEIQLGAAVSVNAPNAELLVLLEDQADPVDPICRLRINGKETQVTTSSSGTGWAAAQPVKNEHWLFLRAPLVKGTNTIDLSLLNRYSSPKVSAWVWAWKPGVRGKVDLPNGLPTPESIYLDAVQLLAPVDLATVTQPDLTLPTPVERIDGIYADALPETDVTHEPDKLVRNKSIAQAPIAIVGRRFMRGLGTFAPSKLTVKLDGKYSRFQSWVGIDAGVAPNYFDRSSVTFEIWVDGTKRWESGPMMVRDDAKWADIDITGAKSLDLVTTDLRKTEPSYSANWANWADARLVR